MTPYKIRQIFLIQFCSVSSLAHHFIWQLSRWNNHLSFTSRKYCILHSYRGKDTSPSHDVSWQTAHTSNYVYQQIHGLVSQCTLQGKSSLTAYLSVHQIQHCNTRPSGGFSEKTQGKIPPLATNYWKDSIMDLLCSLSSKT